MNPFSPFFGFLRISDALADIASHAEIAANAAELQAGVKTVLDS